jgi:hypothetical protein
MFAAMGRASSLLSRFMQSIAFDALRKRGIEPVGVPVEG